MANDRNRNRFVDHALFLLAAKAFQDTGLGSPELIPVRDRLIKIIFSDFYAELDEAIYSLADKGIRVMKNRLERQAVKPKNIQNLWDHIEVLEDTMIQLRQQQDLFGETFPGKASMNAMRIARAAAEDDPTAKLAQYASIPMLTGQLKLKNWISDVAQLAGAPISESELEINEASTASNLGSDLRDAEKDLLLAPPNSLESAEAQDRKAQILQEIDDTQKNARSNNNILGLVSAAATPQEVYTQKTKTGRELGMGSNMERAMLAQGKVMIAAGAGAGKCITGDTLVQTEHGFIPIGEFASYLEAGEDAPLSLVIHGKDGPEKTSDIYNDGIRATRRITTSQGYELEGTAAHKIQVLRNGALVWATLGEIVEGDVAVIDRRPGLFAERPFQRKPLDPDSFRTNATPHTSIPLDLTSQVASLLGWIVSEGYVRRSRWQIALSTTDLEQRDAYLAAMDGLIQATESLDDRNRRQYVLTFSRPADIQALMGFGLTRTLAGEKEIPHGILRSPKPVVVAFLRALFDGDGGVTDRSVEYCTASSTLASQVHTLLTAFGVPSKKKFRPNAGQGAWHLIIGGLGLRKFASEIGFGLKSKQARLDAIVSTTSNTNIDVIPGVDSSSWFFDPIVEIEDGSACVYDFVVPNTHSFSAGGFINHNTRLLAGKVTYLIKEQGISPDQIIAVSFTKKSALELKRRIEEYGVPGASKMKSFATINSLGVTICTKYGLMRGKSKIESWDEQKLIRMAMQQVGMRSDAPKPPNTQIGLLGEEPEFWGKTTPATPTPAAPAPKSAPPTPPQPPPPSHLYGSQYKDLIDDLIHLNTFKKDDDWKPRTHKFLTGIRNLRGTDQLSPKQYDWVKRLMGFGGISIKGINASLTESVEVDEGFWTRLGSEVRNRIAATEQQVDVDRKLEASKDLEGAAPSNLPQAAMANMWFNKGWESDAVLTGQKRGNIKPGDVVRYISKKSGSLISPDKAFTELGSNLGEFVWNEELEKNEFVPYKDAFLACAYGAFLWLKDTHESFKHTFTFDDQILLAANALRNRPDIRADMQKSIKHLIVDECQDANKAQQVLFGLIAGTVDPATMEDYGDNRIAINTFMQIGDDKQSIYGFRGATPNEFIKRSDLKGGGFKTHLLDTNYRSGGMIVGAANALMEHQKLDGKNVQVPMVCNVKASSEGQGTVTNVRPLTPAAAVEYVADHIQELLDSGTETLGDAAETTFGIVTRTNGEATDYAMALIKRGIVFRMKKRYHPLLQSTIRNGASLMRLAAKNTSAKDLDDALLYIIQNFVAGLGKTFIENARKAATGTLVDFFLSGDWRKVAGKSGYWKGACESMVPFITSLRQMAEQDLTPALLLDSILNLPMPGDIRNNETGVEEERLPIKAHLVKKLKEDVKATEDLLDEHMDANGNVPESAYEDAALAPVSRLFDMASDFANTEQFLSYYDDLVKISEKTFVESRDDKEDDVKGAVILDTVHQWKGLEAKHVFIPATQGVFPPNEGVPGEETKGRVISPGELLEERRLFYVALTRGKESVTTLSPQYRDLDGEKPIPMAPSRFIGEACIPSAKSAGLPPVPEDDDSVMFDDQYKAYMEG